MVSYKPLVNSKEYLKSDTKKSLEQIEAIHNVVHEKAPTLNFEKLGFTLVKLVNCARSTVGDAENLIAFYKFEHLRVANVLEGSVVVVVVEAHGNENGLVNSLLGFCEIQWWFNAKRNQIYCITMPKKKATINPRVIARSVRINERHKQSKAKTSEEVPVETNENGVNPKCKLRDVKNNKKKNDKKELSRLLFAKVVPEKPKNNAPPNNVQNNNSTTGNKRIVEQPKNGPARGNKNTSNKPAVKKEKQELKKEIPNQNGAEAAEAPKPAKVEPVSNGNTSNAANKKTTLQQLFNGEKVVINYPKIYGSGVNENLAFVPKNGMNCQDYLNTQSLSYFKYFCYNKYPSIGNSANTPIVFGHTKEMLNKNAFQISTASTSGTNSNSTQNAECLNTIASAARTYAEIWNSDVFNTNERVLIKNISEQFSKLRITSVYLEKIRENLKHIIKFQETKEVTELMDDKELQDMIIKSENESSFKIKETELNNRVKDIFVKEKEFSLLEADLKKQLINYLKSLPYQFKRKLRVTLESKSNRIVDDPDGNSENGMQQLLQILRDEADNGRGKTTQCIKKRYNKGPVKLSRKQKRKKKKYARRRRNTANLTFALPVDNDDTEVLNEDLNVSNTTIDLPDRDANDTFEINFEDPDDANEENENGSQSTSSDETEQISALMVNLSGTLPNMSGRIDSPLNSEHENTTGEIRKMDLSQDEIFFLVHIINDRTSFAVEHRETYVTKFFSLTGNPKIVFKSVKNDSEIKTKTVIKFINNNFPFVEEDDDSSDSDGSESDGFETDSDVDSEDDTEDGSEDGSEEGSEDGSEDESEESGSEIIENEPVIREVDPEVQERMDQYENTYFEINIAAVSQLIPQDPLNETQYEIYEKNRNELNEKFSDLFEMNNITL